jgi:pantetheine-phosphate adenylyltransferase
VSIKNSPLLLKWRLNMENIALYSGSFDPPTNGHLWVIEKIAKKYDKVYVSIGVNPSKNSSRFSLSERLDMLNEMVKDYTNVSVSYFSGMYQADYADIIGAKYIIRGARNAVDFDYETDVMYINHGLNSELETEILAPPKDLLQISSTAVLALVGCEAWQPVVSKMVPNVVFKKLLEYQLFKNIEAIKRFNGDSSTTNCVIAAYSEVHRKYHGLNHLITCINEFNSCEKLLKEPNLVKFALMYHDFIYKTLSKTNEEESAIAAVTRRDTLGARWLPNDTKTKNLILATKHTEIQEDNDCKYLCDIDLAALGYSYRIFEYNNFLIREEYPEISTEKFIAGRIQFLESMHNKEFIYHTDFFRNKYELKAKDNIKRYLRL